MTPIDPGSGRGWAAYWLVVFVVALGATGLTRAADDAGQITPLTHAGVAGFHVPRAQFIALQTAWESERGYLDEIANLRRALAAQEIATAAAVRTSSATRTQSAAWERAFQSCHADLMRRLTEPAPAFESPLWSGAVGCALCGGMCVGLAYAVPKGTCP